MGQIISVSLKELYHMITIPKDIETVSPEACARLLEKVWRARLRLDPYANLLNTAWKRYYKHSERHGLGDYSDGMVKLGYRSGSVKESK